MTFYQKNIEQEYNADEMQLIRKTLEEEGYGEQWHGPGTWVYMKDNGEGEEYMIIYHPYKGNYSLVKIEEEI